MCGFRNRFARQRFGLRRRRSFVKRGSALEARCGSTLVGGRTVILVMVGTFDTRDDVRTVMGMATPTRLILVTAATSEPQSPKVRSETRMATPNRQIPVTVAFLTRHNGALDIQQRCEGPKNDGHRDGDTLSLSTL